MVEDKTIEKTEEKINKILDTDITSANLENLYKLSKIRHMAKEDKEMYNNYEGRRAGYDNYGNGYNDYNGYNYLGYGTRGRDMKYRGHEYIDRMSNEYGRYMESRNRYGAGEETDKSYHYMVKALEDFIKVLEEEADTPQQKQQLREALQNSMR